MARQLIFSTDTTLYHATEGARTFPAGEQDPGGAWMDRPGGEQIGKASVAQAAKDLIEAENRVDALSTQLERNAHDIATLSAERDEAVAKVEGLEQDVLNARKDADEAATLAETLSAERDHAVTEATNLRAKLADFDPDGDESPGGSTASPEKDELIAQLTELKATFDKRWGVAKLRAALDAATAPKA